MAAEVFTDAIPPVRLRALIAKYVLTKLASPVSTPSSNPPMKSEASDVSSCLSRIQSVVT